MRYTGLLLACGLLVSAAGAQPPGPPPLPSSSPPSVLQQINVVHNWSNDKQTLSLVADHFEYQSVLQEVDVIVVDNGVQKTVKKQITVNVPVQKKIVMAYALKHVKATDVNGKPLTTDEMFQRLPPGSAVLVLPEGYQLPNSHKRLFNKDAVILTPPPQVAQ